MHNNPKVEPTEQPCATCKWGEFMQTKHTPPRVKRNECGQCTWPLPTPQQMANSIVVSWRRIAAIWPDNTGCPMWEER
jgi:hypothetical protein